MTDIERKADEAARLLREISPYLDVLEKTAFEAMLSAISNDEVMEMRRRILTIRNFRETLRSVITQGLTSARKAPAVA